MNPKPFSLGAILNYADGRLFTTTKDVTELADFMFADGHPGSTTKPPAVSEAIKDTLLKQLPLLLRSKRLHEDLAQLSALLKTSSDRNATTAQWLREAEAKYGATHMLVSPTAPLDAVPCRWQLVRRADGLEEVAIDAVSRPDGPDRFAVRRGGNVLNREGEWEYEPSPSHRDDDFLARCRFASLEEAKAAYQRSLK